MYLAIEGVIGVGKTSLARLLQPIFNTELLLEIFEERYRRKSTLITAQLPVAQWHEMIGEPTIADAILDRIVHNAHRIALEGDSMRKQKPRPLLTEA